ncbi:hypothetical protein Glove_15g6 [Diversispora epigaea]|uniref:Protein kinase domain-containing protein n=1 Tax=Diversispora epigaea TaxID=1348612 RepID=A0A397JX02_9GLOM|nr:hypothetical protein Glove_15g6 [Diversispora epigaea]
MLLFLNLHNPLLFMKLSGNLNLPGKLELLRLYCFKILYKINKYLPLSVIQKNGNQNFHGDINYNLQSFRSTQDRIWYNYGKTLISNYSGLIGSILKLPDTIQKENITFYKYSEFQNPLLKFLKKTVALENVNLNDNNKFTLDNLINEKRLKDIENWKHMIVFLNSVASLKRFPSSIFENQFPKNGLGCKIKSRKTDCKCFDVFCIHSNDIIHRKFNFENILVHNGILKLNVFGLTKIISDSLSFLANKLGPIHCMDSQY